MAAVTVEELERVVAEAMAKAAAGQAREVLADFRFPDLADRQLLKDICASGDRELAVLTCPVSSDHA